MNNNHVGIHKTALKLEQYANEPRMQMSPMATDEDPPAGVTRKPNFP